MVMATAFLSFIMSIYKQVEDIILNIPFIISWSTSIFHEP